MIYRQIEVNLRERSYPIYAGANMVSSFAPTCRKHNISDSIVIITDRNVGKFHLQSLRKNLEHYNFDPLTIEIPPGENQKSIHRTNLIITEMLKKKIMRSSSVIALGGGVVGDLAGFVASIYQRGIKLIQVPTTLLAQVDSSIGGKVGVNHSLGKNMIGAFHQPVFVWMDIEYLKTLPQREAICGIGEIVKYGIIKDAELFFYIESNIDKILELDTEFITHVISKCADIKADIVSQDEKETGIRAILNYGHTIGHGLESAGDYKLLKHGEAILFGMIAEAYIAKEIGLMNLKDYERIFKLVRNIPMKIKLNQLELPKIIEAMWRDKKRIGKKMRFVLPTKIGEAKIVDNVDRQLIKQALKISLA